MRLRTVRTNRMQCRQVASLARADGHREAFDPEAPSLAAAVASRREPSQDMGAIRAPGDVVEPGAAERRIAVGDACPARALGVVTALEHAGLSAEVLALDELSRLVCDPAPRAAVINLEGARDLHHVTGLRAGSSALPIVALLPAVTPELARRALLAGATGVGELNAPLVELAQVVGAALFGQVLLSHELASALAGPAPRCMRLERDLTESELRILRALVAGATVAELAQAASFSEREMHRRLRQLYIRMGVRDRAHAIVVAVQDGLADDTDTP